MAHAGPYKVILNPFGGRLRGPTKVSRLCRALDALKLDYNLVETTAPGHGRDLARQAVQEGWPVVVAAGGDGTINEVVNGMLAARSAGEVGILGIIPFGTANDLADMLELPSRIDLACQRLARGQTRLIDVGQVNGHYFVNNSAVGLEPVVTLAHERMRWLKGELRYIVAALKGIAGAKFWSMTVRWDDGEYAGPLTLVSVGNSRRTGGSFYMTPAAQVDDGLLDFIYGVKASRWEILKLLPRTFNGSHIHHPLITYRRTTTLSITASPPTPIQADGEIIDTAATEINYRIMPHQLRVIV